MGAPSAAVSRPTSPAKPRADCAGCGLGGDCGREGPCVSSPDRTVLKLAAVTQIVAASPGVIERGKDFVQPVILSPDSATLWHYIVVRTDLPLGQQMAQAVHAANQSVSDWINATVRRRALAEETRVVVLAVEDVNQLLHVRSKLGVVGVCLHTVVETEGSHTGFTALGLWPMDGREREDLRPILGPLKLWRG